MSMKKMFALLLCVCVVFVMVSCEKDPFDAAIDTLAESGMTGEEYSQEQIDEFEGRFTKMALENGFARVTHYRSQNQYAYIIEFESETDAQKFYDTVGTSNYDIVKSENVVVWGDSYWIGKIEFD